MTADTATKVTRSSASTPNSRLPERAGGDRGDRDPDDHAEQHHARPLRHHHPLHPARLRAERHAHADLPGPLGDDVGQHAVLPDGAEDEGERAR